MTQSVTEWRAPLIFAFKPTSSHVEKREFT